MPFLLNADHVTLELEGLLTVSQDRPAESHGIPSQRAVHTLILFSSHSSKSQPFSHVFKKVYGKDKSYQLCIFKVSILYEFQSNIKDHLWV